MTNTTFLTLLLVGGFLASSSGVEKAPPSQQQKQAVAAKQAPSRIKVSDLEAALIGKQIWRNECGGTKDGLLGWNQSETFASLGIGHFIWYPKGNDARYEESFPALLQFLQVKKVPHLPSWLLETPDCPWNTKRAFDKAKSSKDKRLIELREFLYNTVPQQTEFVLHRLERSLDKMTATVSAPEAHKLKQHFYALAETSAGKYALMDYVNFKGDGTNPNERYKGEGWGLLQVLQAMGKKSSGEAAVQAFAKSAEDRLRRRTENHPVDRRWLKGWTSRVSRYPQGVR